MFSVLRSSRYDPGNNRDHSETMLKRKHFSKHIPEVIHYESLDY
jgi:hypothetical protein